MSWNYGGSSSTRLRDWLDPDNTSATVLDGMEDGMLSEGTLPTNATWAGTHTVTGNITVPSGITLTIEPGSTISFDSDAKLTINGTLIAEGTSYQGITFQGIYGIWYGIEFNYGSSSSKIKYCDINNAQVGVHMIHTNVDISYNTIHDNWTGLLFENYSDGSGTVNHDEIYYNDAGIQCETYSDPQLFTNNVIHDNYDDFAVSGDGTCAFSLGIYSDQGYNSLYDNDQYTVYSTYAGTIWARYNWWGSSDPDPTVSWNVNWANYLSYDPNSGFRKGMVESKPLGISMRQTIGTIDTLGMAEVDHAYAIYRAGDYEEAAALFEKIVHKYPDHFSARRALSFLYKCNKQRYDDATTLSLLNDMTIAYPDKELAALAQNISVGELIRQGEYEAAIARSQTVRTSFTDTDYSKYALFNLGSIYWYFLDDKITGEVYYRQFIAQYPADNLSISALATLGEWQPETMPKPVRQPLLVKANNTPDRFGLDQNYPNPFNPVTEIGYQVPQASHVILSIFDAKGREVTKLADNEVDAGYHKAVWVASNLPSGVYFCKMQAGNFVATNKLLLLK